MTGSTSVRSRRRRPVLPLPAALGAAPGGARWERIQRSPQFADGEFRNPIPSRTLSPASIPQLLREQLSPSGRRLRHPASPVPVHRPSAADWSSPAETGLRVTWMGHSSVLVELDGFRVLFDPVWSERCSPFTFAGPKRLHPVPTPIRELPRLDAVVISHDHYDHLDMPSIRALARTGTSFAVPLGVGADLERWGVSTARTAELDWGESVRIGERLTLTATPGRHFCGRGLSRRQHTLWASWVVAGPEHRVYHSGDTGYFDGFADVGATHGPFDLTMIQVGAYSEHWPDIHMTPEEGLRAHADLGGGEPSGTLLPIHWGTFNLAHHPWSEPAERMMAAAPAAGARIAVPRPGQPFEPAVEQPLDPWWRFPATPAAAPTARSVPAGAR